MIRPLQTATAVGVVSLWLTCSVVHAQLPSTINFDVPGPADWNTASNWVIPNFMDVFVPGDGFPDEIAGISNGGIAELTSQALFPVRGVVIGETHDPGIPNPTEEEGTLNLRGNGSLVVTDPGSGATAALRVGDAGRGVLNMDGGTITTVSMSLGGAANSAVNLRGSSTLAVSETVSLQRITRIEGPNVVFDVEGDLNIGGTFIPVITADTHSPITAATGRATLGGTLQVQFGAGHTPSLGDSWTLIDAASVSGTFALDTSQLAGAPRGATFAVTYDQGGSGDVVLSLANRLILSVNRATGVTSFENAIGADIEIDGYTIGSPSGFLDPGGWNSLQGAGVGDWMEANPTSNNISELEPFGTSSIAAGQSFDIGAPYNFVPTAIGESGDELTFSYHVPGVGTVDGIVEFTGPHNNMVLLVDPLTGEAAIQNQSMFSADIDGYRIGSESGSLLPGDGDWLSFQDAGVGDWNEANPTANNLSELNPFDSTLFNTGDLVHIGSPFDVGGFRDLIFQFRQVTGELIPGIVQYGPIDVEPMQVGDTNGDGVVNIDDLNNVRNNFGAMGPADGSLAGDAFPFDGLVNIDDLNGVRNNFGAMVPLAAVPEPSAWLMLCFSGVLISGRAFRRRRSRSSA